MLARRDPNASGRTSRASNLSAMSRATYRQQDGPDKQDLLATAPGVMSMLRTSTEMGNVGGLTGDRSGMGNVPRAPQRRGASSRLSTASSMSGTSSRASRHHRQWPSSSSAPRRASVREPPGPQYVAHTLSPTLMNLPGPSPLVPMHHRNSRSNRESQRSFSMTNASQPTFRLSSNRSLGSLRSHEHIQRPKSPYIYPTRLRRPSYRPASPALSDVSGSRPRRLHANGSQGQLQHQGQRGLRMPSETSLDRASAMPHRPSRGHHPAYFGESQSDIPPVPPLFHSRFPLERPRAMHRSVKGSFSSGSTNMRHDSDTPSSDQPSPPTPREASSLQAILSQAGTSVFADNMTGILMNGEAAMGPRYYDYSEQFERDQILEPEVNPVETSFVNNIKAIQGEHRSSEPLATSARGTWISGTTRASNTVVPGIVELPASPVVRRITRELILQALEPASTLDDVDGTAGPSNVGDDDGLPKYLHMHDEVHSTHAETTERDQVTDKRFSVLSQADLGVVSSSTLDFAVRYSIPMVTKGEVGPGAPPIPEREAPLPPDTAPGTEVDISDLLAGYQHTESRHENQPNEEVGKTSIDAESGMPEAAESRALHIQKSSDAQSFKSATDVLDPGNCPEDGVDAKSYKSCSSTSAEREPPIREVDAHSFKTAQDVATPGRSMSMPSAKPPSLNPVHLQTPRPTSEAQVSSPPLAVIRKLRVPTLEPTFPLANRMRVGSKPSIQQSLASISESSSTLSATRHPPLVPPRDSSTSKEAQRSMGVASWMLFKRWSKRPSKDEDQMKAQVGSRENLGEPRQVNSVASSQHSLEDVIKTPEKALFKETVVLAKGTELAKDCVPLPAHNAIAATTVRQRLFSGPPSVVSDISLEFSPQDFSSRTPAQNGVLKSEDNARSSHTTTHLVWHGRKSLHVSNPGASITEPHLPLLVSNENTTTDLRLSQYRYPGGLHYLPDLKEESHEDSSLNTSASNLKNSNFRFPFGFPGGVRASVDDGVLVSRRSSIGSHRRSALQSALGQTHELPSMNFSRMNLFEKLEQEFELGLRHSRSLDQLPTGVPVACEGTPQRPVSAGEMREKYRSFCDKLDRFDTPKETERAEMKSLLLMRGALSPELLAEIEQVTVPSVNGLTERLSEFLPSLREYYKLGSQGPFVAEELIMEHAMGDIHEVSGPVQKRSSARLRPIAGSPHMVVIEDALYEELTNSEKAVGDAVINGDEGGERAQGESRASAKTKDNSSTRPKTPFAELEAPLPALIRPRTLTVGHQGLRGSVEPGLTTRSLRSFASTPTRTDTRPWNSDKNYPWATSSIPSVDISLPLPTAIRHSPRPGPSHLRNNLSDASTVNTLITPIGSPFGFSSSSSAHARQLQRYSIFGRNGDQPHAVGERYPTSALTPPTAIFRDDFSASDTSDDDTEPKIARKAKFSLKKRFSSTRKATLDDNTRGTGNKSLNTSSNPLNLASPVSTHRSVTSVIQDTAGEARVHSSKRHTFRDAEALVAQGRRPHSKLFSPIFNNDNPRLSIMDNYKQDPGYYHYMSVEFATGLYYSNCIFLSYLMCKCFRRQRPWDPPNTPRSDVEDGWSSDDGYEDEEWGPDEDFYLSEVEGFF